MAFDVVNNCPTEIQINSLWLVMGQNAAGEMKVFISRGGYIAAGSKESRWTLLKTWNYIRFSYQGPLELDLETSAFSIAPGEKYGIYVHCNYKSWDPLQCGVIYRWKETTNFKPPSLEDDNLLVAHTGVRLSNSKVPFAEFASNPELSTTMPMMVEYQNPSSSLKTYVANKGYLPDDPGFGMEYIMGRSHSFGFLIKAKDKNVLMNGIHGLNVNDWGNVKGLQLWFYSKMSENDQRFGNAPVGREFRDKWTQMNDKNVKMTESGSWLEFSEPILIEKRTTTGLMIISSQDSFIYNYYDGGKNTAEDNYLLIPKGGWTLSDETLSIFSESNPKDRYYEVWCFHGKIRYSI